MERVPCKYTDRTLQLVEEMGREKRSQERHMKCQEMLGTRKLKLFLIIINKRTKERQLTGASDRFKIKQGRHLPT